MPICTAAPNLRLIIDLDWHGAQTTRRELRKRPHKRSPTPWRASRRRARRRCACQHMPPCRTCTRTHTTHTSAHAHTQTHTQTHRHTHAHTHAHCNPLQNTRAHEPARTRSHARTLKHTQCHSLARIGCARWTTCADELLQLRQQLEAQGVELQQLRLSNAALFAAARRRQRAGTATPPRGAGSEQPKARPTKVITKAHDGMAELQQEWEEGQDGHLRLRPIEQAYGD